jgi:hypothetical protein
VADLKNHISQTENSYETKVEQYCELEKKYEEGVA